MTALRLMFLFTLAFTSRLVTSLESADIQVRALDHVVSNSSEAYYLLVSRHRRHTVNFSVIESGKQVLHFAQAFKLYSGQKLFTF